MTSDVVVWSMVMVGRLGAMTICAVMEAGASC